MQKFSAHARGRPKMIFLFRLKNKTTECRILFFSRKINEKEKYNSFAPKMKNKT